MPSLSVPWILILFLSVQLPVDLPGGLFRSGYLTKIMHEFLSVPMRATYSAYVILIDLIKRNNIWREIKIMQVLNMQFLPSFYHFLPLSSKYLSQHPVFEKPQPPSSFSVEEPDVMLFSVSGREII
jgi:hypothetical protein